MAHDILRLPATIIGPADLGRAKRDLDMFNELQHQADLRAKKSGVGETVHAGRVISELATLNEYDLLDSRQRSDLLSQLESVLTLAPVVTMSFAVDPSAAFLGRIVDWLRTSINPQILVRVGLQPNIAAGCTLRTSSAIYDFSLRQKLIDQRPLLVQRLHEAGKTAAPVLQAPTVAGAAQ